MTNATRGSTWNKWDLHVHTPESFVHHYPGDKEAAWDAFLSDLEKLPREFKVLGINDYVFVDGYERALKAKREQGRLPNIDLLLPVVELRLDKFGGVLRADGDGYAQSGWSRINAHVIFDQVEPELIRQQFLAAIAPSYSLVPGSTDEGKWSGVISRDSLETLGNSIIESVPADKRGAYHSALMEGFNNLNVSFDGLRKALQNPHLCGKFLVAIGKTEWDNLKWEDHTVAEKKTLINDADLVFTAAESPEAYAKARKKLVDSNVNANLLDCSDAHWLSDSDKKDRIGHCHTWVKADATFRGLLQALAEFEDRVYVGDNPPKRQLVEQNKTKFIESVKVAKKHGSQLQELWFDVEIPLNSDLVAVIGNKGSGKSALADIVALAGNTKNHGSFSFLTPTRFRNPRMRLAQHFVGSLEWRDGLETVRDLDEDPEASNVERVKYLPQSYLEVLCNELGDGGSSTFDAELRKIIYSHVPDDDRIGLPSMDELLDFKVAEINRAVESVRQEISKVNAEIIEAEKRLTLGFRKSLEEQLEAKRAELTALQAAKPQAVEDPSASPEAEAESKQAVELIDELEKRVEQVAEEEACLREKKAAAAKRQAMAERVAQALANQERRHALFMANLKGLVAELDSEISVEGLMVLSVNSGPIDTVARSAAEEIGRIEARLHNLEPGSLIYKRNQLVTALEAAKAKLGERQRQFVRYKEALVQWERARTEIAGAPEKAGSIAWLEREIDMLAALPQQVAEQRMKRAAMSKEIHGHVQSMVNEYRRLYGPVQTFVKSAEKMDMSLPLDFEVRIEETGFKEQFLNRLNRQVRGSFAGVDESSQLLGTLLREASFAAPDDALAFAEKIDDMLRFDRREGQGRETKLVDQLRKGVAPQEILDFLFGLGYLSPRYSLTFDGQEIGQLSPGERGLLLLVFYLLVDKDDIPIVIDQPEENLDNQTIFKILVKCIKKAKERRQVIMVTHNPNLAVVCDAEQIIYASCDKSASRFSYESGAIECPKMMAKVVEILEGTEPAFRNRQSKYKLQ